MTPMRMPVVFVGHGSPMNAVQDNAFTRALRDLGARLPRPSAVCVVSAHWVTPGTRVTATARPETIHDFYGFPRPLYDIRYPAPGAPGEAHRVSQETRAGEDVEWGLDHGAWAVLRHMYPAADVPVFQVSLDRLRPLAEHLDVGRDLRPLRDRGVLVLGSGNLVHNLPRMLPDPKAEPYPWASEFDAKVEDALLRLDAGALAHPDRWGEALFEEAHPTAEHYAPVLYCVGAAAPEETVTFPHEGIDHGSVSMRVAVIGG